MRVRQCSISACAGWMFALGLALLLLPVANGLVAGAVGGYKARSVGRAIGAAIAPSVFIGAAFWFVCSTVAAPLPEILNGLSVELWAVISAISLLAGAILGALLAPSGQVVVLRAR
jgi:hypothetical protein